MIHGIVIRGTTPTHEFDLPYPIEIIQSLRITYGQSRKPVHIKKLGEYGCEVTDGKLKVSLNQIETFAFNPSKHVFIEIRIKLNNGKVVRTEEPIVLKVVDTMDEEVMD